VPARGPKARNSASNFECFFALFLELFPYLGTVAMQLELYCTVPDSSAPPASATRCERHSCAMRGVRGDSKLVGRTVFNRYRRRRQIWTRRWAIRLELAAGVCVAVAAATCGLEFWPTALALACMLVAAHVGGCAQQVLRRCWCYTASGREWAEAVVAARSRSPSPSPSPSGPSGPSGPSSASSASSASSTRRSARQSQQRPSRSQGQAPPELLAIDVDAHLAPPPELLAILVARRSARQSQQRPSQRQSASP
jgi:hypothetical protein